MKWFVYIIQSQTKGIFYKGCTSCIEKRLFEHNNELGRFTKGKGPWLLVFLKEFEAKKEALIFERKIKKANSEYLKKIIEENRI
jgi:putative endonuclease